MEDSMWRDAQDEATWKLGVDWGFRNRMERILCHERLFVVGRGSPRANLFSQPQPV